MFLGTEQSVESSSGYGRGGLGLAFARAGKAIALVQGKPIAKVGPILVRRRTRIGFGAVPAAARKIKPAIPASAKVPSAFRATKRPADGLLIRDGGSAVPTHNTIIPRCDPDRKGLAQARRPTYDKAMYTFTPCAAGCGNPSLSGAKTCALHVADPPAEADRLAGLILAHHLVKDLNAAGLVFEGIDFSGHHFYGCNFAGAKFLRCLFTESVMRMCFFDFADFSGCDFSKCDFQFASWAGSTLRDCTFEGSELVHINFGGATIVDCTFNDSNLYNSRFIGARIESADFIDCNIKKTYFIKAHQERVSFKSSNTAEAVFELGDLG